MRLAQVGTLAADTQFLKAGHQFDSSRERKKPLTFIIGVGAVIKGWDEGIIGMKLGEARSDAPCRCALAILI